MISSRPCSASRDVPARFRDTGKTFTTLVHRDTATGRGIGALREWTGKARADVVFDSTVDEFTHDRLFEKVRGKRNIALIAFTTDGDVFGGLYSVAATEQDKSFWNQNNFLFSFESYGRCSMPMRFDVKEEMKDEEFVKFFKNNQSGLFVDIGGSCGCFWLGNEKVDVECRNLSMGFMGIEDNTLTGKQDLTCTRLVAIYLESLNGPALHHPKKPTLKNNGCTNCQQAHIQSPFRNIGGVWKRHRQKTASN